MPRRALQAILILASSTAFALLLAEGVVRWLHLAPPLPLQYTGYVASAYLTYGPPPLSRQQGIADSGEFTYDFQHNRFGLQDVDHEFVKPAGTFRILGLGDSFTYGVGAAFDETWLVLLERRLNKRLGQHPRVEIIKAGVARFWPETERLLLERLGVRFAPDLILVGFTPNDVVDSCLGLDAVRVDESGFMMTHQAKELGRAGLYLFLHSHLARSVLARYSTWRDRDRCPFDLPYERGLAGHEENWLKVEAEYSRMAAIAGGIGAQLVIVHIPDRGPWTARQEYPAARLAAWAERHGAGFIDILPAMRAHPQTASLYYRRDPHCTPAGYALIAAEVTRHLEASGMVP